MAKTLVEKVNSPKPDVSIFKISGVLGYHENQVLKKFFSECTKKNIGKLIMDFSALGSLGGGCANIIRRAALGGDVFICITGASRTVQAFLEKAGEIPILFETSVETALKKIDKEADAARQRVVGGASTKGPSAQPRPQGGQGGSGEALPPGASSTRSPERGESGAAAAAGVGGSATAGKGKPGKKSATTGAGAGAGAEAPEVESPAGKDLQRKILRYRSLFSLNQDFSRIHEKSGLLDAFLLTTMAQVGVESAAFLEFSEDAFVAVSWKGFETADPNALTIKLDEVDTKTWLKSGRIHLLADAPINEAAKERLDLWGMAYIAPFIVYGELRGVVLLGDVIRKDLDEDSFDYLGVLINQTAIAYENSCRFEEQSQRTLGLVHSLISMIEENTLSRGNTENMVNYTYSVAKAVHYPEENIRDLIYGTVLRDIGMIKVSDLIVRSPRELLKEEWEIIKQHPTEGAEMLHKMKFSEHTTNIVLCHHERFNGEGYPNGLQGSQIPLGARIVSVVESFAAMLQDRPTRPALSREEALSTLKENWGMRYDPEIVEKFVEIVEEEIRSGETVKYKDREFFTI